MKQPVHVPSAFQPWQDQKWSGLASGLLSINYSNQARWVNSTFNPVISILQSMTSVLYKGAILNQPRQFPPVSKLESLVRDFPLEKHGEPLSSCLE